MVHSPGHLREAFIAMVDGDDDAYSNVFYDTPLPRAVVLERLWNSSDIMPKPICSTLGLPQGATFAMGVGVYIATGGLPGAANTQKVDVANWVQFGIEVGVRNAELVARIHLSPEAWRRLENSALVSFNAEDTDGLLTFMLYDDRANTSLAYRLRLVEVSAGAQEWNVPPPHFTSEHQLRLVPRPNRRPGAGNGS
jgi:hypothetical protein